MRALEPDEPNKDAPRSISTGDLDRVLERYDQGHLEISAAYPDGGCDPLWPRFVRAVMNQSESGDATISRYAIWANTVRDNIIQGIAELEAGNSAESRRFLVRAANSLSAFADVQAKLDPFRLGRAD
jgi:hypothetical protein